MSSPASQPAPDRAPMSGRDLAAVLLLLLGGFVFLFGWAVGVVLLWTSDTWRTKDKVIGTLLVPGGLLTGLVVLFVGLFVAASARGGGGPGGFFLLLVMVVAVLGPFFTTVWLSRAARRID